MPKCDLNYVACRSVISIKLLSNLIEITLWHGCFPVNLLHVFRTPFLKIGKMFKVNNRNMRARCEIRHWRHSGIFIVNFEHISHLCSSVFIVNFEQVNPGWVYTVF